MEDSIEKYSIGTHDAVLIVSNSSILNHKVMKKTFKVNFLFNLYSKQIFRFEVKIDCNNETLCQQYATHMMDSPNIGGKWK